MKQDATLAVQERYRADIDGLRAVAVVAVILVHAGARLSGGFLGVDVFFVISGYLIHRDLASRFAAGTFSVREFYGRRMRRTLPALYVVSFVCMIVAAFVLMPGDYDALARSAVAAGLALSNILFLTQTGYFDQDALMKPLLHTWSLGVEEQFYLVAPLISYGLTRIPSRIRRFVYVGLILAGLAVCVLVQALAPPAAFFLMPTRLWEFFIGCAIADRAMPTIRHRWLAELITMSAFLGLIVSMNYVNAFSPHPGLATIIPCVAAAAIIHSGATTPSLVGALLGTRVFVFGGLISYSLYLWHWPMIVLVDYLGLPMTTERQVVLGLLLLVLSILSWRFIERPFRTAGSPLRERAPILLPIGFAAIALAALAIVVDRGLPQRFPENVAKIASYYDYEGRRAFREGTCFLTSKSGGFGRFDKDTCLHMSPVRPNYLLIGDSHAAQYWIGLSSVFPNVNFLQATASGCKPILGTPGTDYCTQLMNYALRDFLPTAQLDGIIFAASWNEWDRAGFEQTLEHLKKIVPKIIVFGRVPSHEMPLPNLIARGLVENRPNIVFDHQINYPPVVDRVFEKIDGVTYISVFDLLCPDRKCRVFAGPDIPLQFDTSHLTTEGSILVAKLVGEKGLFLTQNDALLGVQQP